MDGKDKADRQLQRMTGEPVPKLVLSLAAPATAGMMVSAVYSLADTYFVSRLGTSAAGAAGVVFSLTSAIQAVGFTLGMGAGGLISQYLGKKEGERAETAAVTSLFASLAAGGIIAALGLAFLDGLVRLLGATPTILPYARDYARQVLPGAPVLCASFTLDCTLRAEGKASLALMGVAAGCALDVLLNPLLIFACGMGIAGAGLAVLLSHAAVFLILLSHYLRGRTIVRLRPRRFTLRRAVRRGILKTGLPSLIHQGLASAASIAINVAASAYGDAAVAAMAIVGRAFYFILGALIGFGQGFQPVAGYNYGAKRYGRLRKAFWFCIAAGFAGLLALCGLGILLAPQIISLFRPDDPLVIAEGVPAFRAQCAVTPVQVFVVISNMMFQSIGRTKKASLIAALRQGICFLPAVWILPRFFGMAGVELSQPAADLASFAVCVPVSAGFLKQLKDAARSGSPPADETGKNP